jgi:hypothetical protein
MWWVVNIALRPLYPQERPGTLCTGGWVGPRAGLDGAENLDPTEIRSPARPIRSESLYSQRRRIHYVTQSKTGDRLGLLYCRKVLGLFVYLGSELLTVFCSCKSDGLQRCEPVV